ncbi:2-dehydropantoate 2-reductase [Leucobacter sp. Psy1]|uniref:ketopantoate reductase family protein n=1 Tax=Leucobacter sp. Psy1 TaxID=2875729 RepID=UPI001CD5564A|nr:ketopantoate reductase family protein [Leucobacter sp. Psy1]UBH05692.1 2-dehydropantoate 2-reductase [Leucobacter sp. Psy1]
MAMKIVVVGAGAMGRLFGNLLIAGGEDVTMVDVDPEAIADLNLRGITVALEGTEHHVAARAARAEDLTDPVDLIMVFTKSMHTRAALDSVRHLVHPATLGFTVQNGLGNHDPLIELLGRTRTLVGMTDYPADLGPDRVVHARSSGSVVIGTLDPSADPACARVAQTLSDSGVRTTVHPAVLIPIWEKLAFNATLNTLTAAAGLTVGEVGASRDAKRIALTVLAETLAVAGAIDMPVDPARVREHVEWALEHHADHRPSMLVDLESGRLTEVDSIGGVVCRLGATHGVAVPVLETLCAIVRLRSAAPK